MTFISKPKVTHPGLPKNTLGLTARDYEGTVSTLCGEWWNPPWESKLMEMPLSGPHGEPL